MFVPALPSATACFSGPVDAHASFQWQTTGSPAPAPRMHQGCHGSETEQ